MRKAFLFYRSFYDATKDLDNELKGKIYDAIINYGLNGEEPTDLSVEQKSILTLVKSKIDEANRKRVNGMKGGRPSSKYKKYF